jgi:hypothetical protein
VLGDRWDELPAGRSMLEILADEHHQLGMLCVDLADLTGPPARRARVAGVLIAATVRHLSAEEQYLYPAVRAALPGGDRLADHEIIADRELLRTLRQLAGARPEEAGYDRLVHSVGAQLGRHANKASRRLFPGLRESCDEVALVRLGNRIEIAEEAAPTRPHPGTPSTPPWNKVVDPALGVADKIRDVLSWRTTYPQDL